MWRQGCKGGTVYRDESRTEQVLHVEKEEKIDVIDIRDTSVLDKGLRPALQCGVGPTFSINTPMGSMHITIRCDPETGEPYDLFINAGKGELGANAQAIARLVSMILRWPNQKYVSQATRLEMIREQLNKIPGHGQSGFGPNAVISFPDSLSRILHLYLKGEFPLSFLPFGTKPLKNLVNTVAQYVPHEVMTALFGEDIGEGLESHKVIKKALTLPTPAAVAPEANFDFCPRCGEAKFKKVAGECPKCIQCGYREC